MDPATGLDTVEEDMVEEDTAAVDLARAVVSREGESATSGLAAVLQAVAPSGADRPHQGVAAVGLPEEISRVVRGWVPGRVVLQDRGSVLHREVRQDQVLDPAVQGQGMEERLREAVLLRVRCLLLRVCLA